MIRVLVEVHPWDGGEPKEIATLEIWNKTEVGEVCDYGFELANSTGQVVRGEVHGHERSIGWAPLVERAIHMAWAALPLAPMATPDQSVAQDTHISDKKSVPEEVKP